MIFNAHHEPVTFTLPTGLGEAWTVELSTEQPAPAITRLDAGAQLEAIPRSTLILRRL
jgi:glycogen operon protein